MDLHVLLSKWEPSFRADRRRNNVRNVIWLLECLLDNVDAFASYVEHIPVYHRQQGKQIVYYVKYDEWPLGRGNSSDEDM